MKLKRDDGMRSTRATCDECNNGGHVTEAAHVFMFSSLAAESSFNGSLTAPKSSLQPCSHFLKADIITVSQECDSF